MAAIDVEIPYVKPNGDGKLPDHAEMFSHIPEFMDMQPAKVRNAREADQDFSIPTTGFQYARLEQLPSIDFMNPDQVTAEYFPALEKLAKKQYVSFYKLDNRAQLDKANKAGKQKTDLVLRTSRPFTM